PNLSLFLTPQFSGKKTVSPGLYVKLYKAIYAGVHAGNPSAAVAIGETSPEGRDKPTGKSGQGQSVAPATFARYVAKTKGLKFTAWAQHPYPTAVNGKALGKARYPNVPLTNLHRFESDLTKWFHRNVPIWITEYGHQTKPQQPRGVTYAQQAAYAKQALTFAKSDPDVQMFVWFTFRDSVAATSNPWRSGIEASSGAHKPAFAAFSSLAHAMAGSVQSVQPRTQPTVVLYVPAIAYYSAGMTVGITYTIKNEKGKIVSRGEPQATVLPDESVAFHADFKIDVDDTYTVTAAVNDASGHVSTVYAALVPIKSS
ncbi:MAG TPA: glycosyl hydrolase, partial [Gaiellaceae bacterium]|nr:glycosyl hydrolase [Gaiellaceae bacterium]